MYRPSSRRGNKAKKSLAMKKKFGTGLKFFRILGGLFCWLRDFDFDFIFYSQNPLFYFAQL